MHRQEAATPGTAAPVTFSGRVAVEYDDRLVPHVGNAGREIAFEMVRGTGIDDGHDGLTEYATVGTYAHFHAESGLFDDFVEALS